MLNFAFSEKGMGLVSQPHFMYDLSRKMFLMLYSINWPNFVVWLSLLLEVLGIMCILIVLFPGYDVINSEINVIFLIKGFCFIHDQMTKKMLQLVRLKNCRSNMYWIYGSVFMFSMDSVSAESLFTPFLSHVSMLYPLKIPENYNSLTQKP